MEPVSYTHLDVYKRQLMDTLSSNILVLSKKGKVLGVSFCPGVEEIQELIADEVGGHVDPLLNERFLGVLSTKDVYKRQMLVS